MIIEYIRYDLKTHSFEELAAAYAEAVQFLRASPECLGYELTRCVEAETSAILRITWTSLDGHVEGFRKSAHFPPFLRLIRNFMGEIVEMRHYRAGDVTWTRS